MTDSLAVGRVTKPIGVRGEVVVEPLTDNPERFAALAQVLVGDGTAPPRPMAVERVRVGHRGVRLALRGVASREEAEALRGLYLFVEPADRIEPGPGRHFVHTLVGLDVVTEEGEPVGTLAEVLKLPAQDVYVVRGERGEIMIPAVREFIIRIDPAAGTVTVRLIEGMA